MGQGIRHPERRHLRCLFHHGPDPGDVFHPGPVARVQGAGSGHDLLAPGDPAAGLDHGPHGAAPGTRHRRLHHCHGPGYRVRRHGHDRPGPGQRAPVPLHLRAGQCPGHLHHPRLPEPAPPFRRRHRSAGAQDARGPGAHRAGADDPGPDRAVPGVEKGSHLTEKPSPSFSSAPF